MDARKSMCELLVDPVKEIEESPKRRYKLNKGNVLFKSIDYSNDTSAITPDYEIMDTTNYRQKTDCGVSSCISIDSRIA